MAKKDDKAPVLKGDNTTAPMAVAEGHNCRPDMPGAVYQFQRYKGLLCQPSKSAGGTAYRCCFCATTQNSVKLL